MTRFFLRFLSSPELLKTKIVEIKWDLWHVYLWYVYLWHVYLWQVYPWHVYLCQIIFEKIIESSFKSRTGYSGVHTVFIKKLIYHTLYIVYQRACIHWKYFYGAVLEIHLHYKLQYNHTLSNSDEVLLMIMNK